MFADPNVVIVGFSFNSDVEQFARKLPHLKFYRYIKNFIDAQYYFGVVTQSPPMTGLAKVADKIFGTPICKGEQMSNWERRPLRLTQQHYGALDAYILVDLIDKLSKMADEKNAIEKFIKVLDNRNFKPVKCDDDLEDPNFLDQRP